MVFGLQTWCPSLYCCFAFYCSHRRRAGSPETVVKESSTICLEKNTEENFNHGCRDCSGPRIVTYLPGCSFLAKQVWMSIGQEKEQNSLLLCMLSTSRLPVGSIHCLPVPARGRKGCHQTTCTAWPGVSWQSDRGISRTQTCRSTQQVNFKHGMKIRNGTWVSRNGGLWITTGTVFL